MAVSIDITAEGIDVSLTGIDATISFRRRLRIRFADIESASVRSIDELKKNLGWRVAGGYFPGRFATGHFLSRNGMKGRQFWSVYRDREVLVIDLVEGRLRRVVLQTPDRVALADQISEAVGTLRRS